MQTVEMLETGSLPVSGAPQRFRFRHFGASHFRGALRFNRFAFHMAASLGAVGIEWRFRRGQLSNPSQENVKASVTRMWLSGDKRRPRRIEKRFVDWTYLYRRITRSVGHPPNSDFRHSPKKSQRNERKGHERKRRILKDAPHEIDLA